MAIPAPNLDDRRFQDLVDDAKRMVMRRCPEWTDHNVSDPGVTLIETFAFMVDQLLYRLNRVPDRMYLKFLDLIGLRLIPPAAASVDVTFWLSSAAHTELLVPAGTVTATLRTETQESTAFSTVAPLMIVPCELSTARTQDAGVEESADRAEQMRLGLSFPAFGHVPEIGDLVLIGLTDSVPNCAVSLDFECRIEGVGVDPTRPPLEWEAWTGEGWDHCEVDRDETGGLNRAGSVVLHVPAGHRMSVIGGDRAGWIRARVIDQGEDGPRYSSSPIIDSIAACTIGGTVRSIHAEIVEDDVLGTAEGVAGQRFPLSRVPVLSGVVDPVLQVSDGDGWQEWTRVDDFTGSDPSSTHYVLDPVAGEVIFGPVVREPDGTLRQRGAVPPQDAVVRMEIYTTGGGREGNVGVGAISTLKSSIPFVSDVENRLAAQGGVDGETLDQAKDRGPLLLRTRSRAVTAEDYVAITREMAPELTRVYCLTAGEGDAQAGSVRVLIVPAAAQDEHRIALHDLVPREDTLSRIAAKLDEVRLIGTRVLVEPPTYRGITVVADVVGRKGTDARDVRSKTLDKLYEYLNPLTGGPSGTGWPFGRSVLVGELFAVLQQLPGIDYVEDVKLFSANPVTGLRGPVARKVELEPRSLVFSYEHQVRVNGV
ncbi:putative baseplate assembly protein [Lentzea sp. NEAU-D7]|uniref:putative baseplate assembly protein n=1 Tax=Lentzea sp. NEAU-D7 TaxID=2994667 RepID=UPI00224A70F1|nr:putative baseplate assembly protein [Lentzea sp. NEAU-D7]MCX2954574.1 putative baseplate assembly protein [Lentzea sp. NEAU-D7]